MTAEQIEALRVAAEAATPGPWSWSIRRPLDASWGELPALIGGDGTEVCCFGIEEYRDNGPGTEPSNLDMEFIALANPSAIAELIAENAKLRADAAWRIEATACFAGESLDEKSLNALLWFYRRMENAYGRLPFAEEAIIGLRARIASAPAIPAVAGRKEDNDGRG